MIRLLNLEPCLILQCHLYHLYNFILLKFTAVKCQMILGNIFPFLICKVLIISTPFFIHFLNQLLCTFFFPSRTLDDSLYTILNGAWINTLRHLLSRMWLAHRPTITQSSFSAASRIIFRWRSKSTSFMGTKWKSLSIWSSWSMGKRHWLPRFSSTWQADQRNILFLSCNIDQLFVIKANPSSSARALPIRRPLLPSILFIVITRLLINPNPPLWHLCYWTI